MTEHPTWRSLLAGDRAGWRMAGQGGFHAIADGVIESHGGPGLLWYAAATFGDFVVEVDWRLTHPDDNSGLFLRIPPLADDVQPAIDQGYEVQIDDRAYDPDSQTTGSALHRTGAIYRLAPAAALLSAPVGSWNRFRVTARGDKIVVLLNGSQAARLNHAKRRASGHIALQAHHPGSAVQFRDLRIRSLVGAD